MRQEPDEFFSSPRRSTSAMTDASTSIPKSPAAREARQDGSDYRVGMPTPFAAVVDETGERPAEDNAAPPRAGVVAGRSGRPHEEGAWDISAIPASDSR